VVDPVPDRARIEPPVLDPAQSGPVNPVTIAVRLQAGFLLGEVKSHHHTVNVESVSEDTRLLKLEAKSVPADRDFELTWRPLAAKAPAVGLFKERVGAADYLLAFVTPPAAASSEDKRPREIVLVIDNSGSMGGTSIVQAKHSLLFALSRLTPADRFNVIRFDHTMDVLFPDTVPADAANLARARGFVEALQARGGTEMLPPLKAALADPRPGEAKTLRQVVFLTDGAIGNEQQLLDTIAAERGRSRVFMVGIGSAPNSYLMNRAAELGRGTFTHIGSAEQVEARMRSLLEKLESPVATNLVLRLTGNSADLTPEALPDLYRGEPLVVAARLDGPAAGGIELSGMIGEQPWAVTLPLTTAAEGKGLSKLWARRKIADAEVAATLRNVTREAADQRILALALEHALVSRLTSLVALDKTPSRPDGAPHARTDIPLNLPAGWEFDKVFGRDRVLPLQRAQAAEPAPRPLLDDTGAAQGAIPAVAASSQPRAVMTPAAAQLSAHGGGGVHLPKTATDAELRLLAGLLLLLLGCLIAVLAPRARRT
jgi:Ca-activated chloride channel family protein